MTTIGGRPTITSPIRAVHRDGDIYELWAEGEASTFGEIEGAGNAKHIIAAVNREVSMAGLSMERIKEIRDGCAGVTPGPWSAPIKYERDCYSPITSPDWHAFANVVTRMHNDNAPAPENPASIQGRKTAAHIARLDPQTVTALCDLALAGLAPAPTTGVDGGGAGEALKRWWARLDRNDGGVCVPPPADCFKAGFEAARATHPAPTPAGVTEAMVGRFMDSMFGEYTSPGNDQTWVSPDWMTTKGKVRAALTAALSPSAPAPAREAVLEEALRAAHSYIVNNPDALGYIDVLRRINDALVQP